jgi:hypothetical protein
MRAIRFENAGNANVIKLVEEPIPQLRRWAVCSLGLRGKYSDGMGFSRRARAAHSRRPWLWSVGCGGDGGWETRGLGLRGQHLEGLESG